MWFGRYVPIYDSVLRESQKAAVSSFSVPPAPHVRNVDNKHQPKFQKRFDDVN
jgi:hypothetical protein